jgi:hypothetical protein
MKKRNLWIIAFIAIIGFSFAACDSSALRSLSHQYHNWSSWRTTTAPTCTAAGEETRTCSECGAIQSRTLEETGHEWNWVWVEEGGGTKAGNNLVETDFEVTRTCSRCYNSEQYAVGFLFGSWGKTISINPTTRAQITISKDSYSQLNDSYVSMPNLTITNLTWTAVTRDNEPGFDISGTTAGGTTYTVSVYFSGDGIRVPEFPGTFPKPTQWW